MRAGAGSTTGRGRGWMPLIALTDLTDTAIGLVLPLVLGTAIDTLVTGGESGPWLALAASLIGLAVVADVAGVGAETFCVASGTAWLRERLLRRLLAAGPEGTGRFETGDLVSRVSGGAADAALRGPATISVITAALPPIGAVTLLLVIDHWLAVALLAALVLVVIVLRAFTRQTADTLTRYQEVQGRIAARLAESLAGARTIAAAGTVAREQDRVLADLPELRMAGMRTWHVLARSTGQATVLGPLGLVAVLAVGGIELSRGAITAGELFAAIQYAGLAVGLGTLTGALGRVARAAAGGRRLADITALTTVRYGVAALSTGDGPAGRGSLEFTGVSVRAEDGTVLLDGVDLDLPGGATIAVIGRSGAGKSVLAALAARLRDPDDGEIRLDGVALPDLEHGALRTAVGCAFERPALFGRTVADAIGLGRSPAVLLPGARACSHDFVSRLPEGYDTALVDAPMSGGELQRLGLARAWPAERLLVLDDATSSLDMVTEMRISTTLTGDATRRTRLIVTHRASTAARADLVVWLEAARVRAVGAHAVLWAEPEYRSVFGEVPG